MIALADEKRFGDFVRHNTTSAAAR